MMRRTALMVVGVLLAGGCGGDSGTATSQPVTTGIATTVASQPPISQEPPSTVDAAAHATTTPSAFIDAQIFDEGAIPEVPPFQATVVGLAASHDGDWELAVQYGGPGEGSRIGYVKGSLIDRVRLSAMFILPDPGSFVVTDWSQVGWYEHDASTWEVTADRVSGYDPIQFLAWHREPGFSWMRLCSRTTHVPLGTAQIAGREVWGILCEGVQDTWKLWIDLEYGLVLRLESEIRNRWNLAWPPDFEVTDIDYSPKFDPGTFAVVAPSGVPTDPRQYPGNQRPDFDIPPDPEFVEDMAVRFGDFSREDIDLEVSVPVAGGGFFNLQTTNGAPSALLFALINPGMAHPEYWDDVESKSLEALQRLDDKWGDQVNLWLVIAHEASPELFDLVREARGYTFPAAFDTEGLLEPIRDAFAITDTPAWLLLNRNGNPYAHVLPTDERSFFLVDALLGEMTPDPL